MSEYSVITDISVLSPSHKAQMLELYQDEAKLWPNKRSIVDIDNQLKAVCLLIVYKRSDTDQIQGFGMVTGDPDDPLLEDIIVHRSLRGQGVGGAIMRAIIDRMPDKLDLYCPNTLVDFYAKYGFTLERGDRNDASTKCFMRRRRGRGRRDP